MNIRSSALAKNSKFVLRVSSHSQPGFTFLMTVLIVGSVALTVGMSTALRGIGELNMGFAENQSFETLAIADGCVQDALLRLSLDHSYAGGTLNIGDGSCTIAVTSNGSERTINVVANLDRWMRKFTVRVRLSKLHVMLLEWEQDTD